MLQYIVELFMTTFILHGGRSKNLSEQNNDFFKEIIIQTPPGGTILCIYFAKPKEQWREKFANDTTFFHQIPNSADKKFVLANNTDDTFISQLKLSETIYISGGNTYLLIEKLSHIKNLSTIFQDKVIAGSSAGALALSTYFFNTDDNTVGSGLATLPIKIVCHYEESRSNDVNKLRQYKEDLPIYTLREQEFVVVEEYKNKKTI